jgi:hypothetical protein
MGRHRSRNMSAAQVAAKWNTGFSAGAAKARDTVTNTTISWAAPTAAAETQIASGIAQAFSSGRWRQGVARTGDAGWKQAMLLKGVPHMAAGSQLGSQHYATFWSSWAPAVAQIVGQLPARGTYEQNKVRAAAYLDAAHAQKGHFKGLWKGRG